MEVPMDNTRTFEIGGKSYKLEASLGTGIVYANEFRGKLDKPYKGVLADDMLQIFRRNQLFVDERVKVDERGNIVLDENGSYIPDMGGEVRQVENPDYVGYDIEALIRILWAMAFAAGSTKKGYDKFYSSIIHQPAGIIEEASMYATVVLELGGGIIFRQPEGHGGDAASDEAQEAEEG